MRDGRTDRKCLQNRRMRTLENVGRGDFVLFCHLRIKEENMGKKKLGSLLTGIGIVVLLISVFADPLGMEATPDSGTNKSLARFWESWSGSSECFYPASKLIVIQTVRL